MCLISIVHRKCFAQIRRWPSHLERTQRIAGTLSLACDRPTAVNFAIFLYSNYSTLIPTTSATGRSNRSGNFSVEASDG